MRWLSQHWISPVGYNPGYATRPLSVQRLLEDSRSTTPSNSKGPSTTNWPHAQKEEILIRFILRGLRTTVLGDPAFERVNRFWCAFAVVSQRPRRGGLDGAEQGNEVVAAGVVGDPVHGEGSRCP